MRYQKALEKHGTFRAAAKALGIAPSTFQGRLERERLAATARWLTRPGGPAEKPAGSLRAPDCERRPLPKRGQVKHYLLTSAQNNTGLAPCWPGLLKFADYLDAEILVGAVTYRVTEQNSKGQKKGSEAVRPDYEEVWDEAVIPYMANSRIELAPGLVWCGELNILPTAVDPLSGLESYTGRATSIIPHAKFAVKSVAAPKHSGAKFLWTTGSCTLRNYIQKKSGQKAAFHHGYGAALVEVIDDGSWWIRHLNADSDGVFYDLDRRADSKGVTVGHRPESVVWGDVHVRTLQNEIRELQWGRGGILDQLRARRQAISDVLDFRSQNHHDRKDPWRQFEKHCTGGSSVAEECAEAQDFLRFAARDWCETLVVRSNHDEALVRWLKEADFRADPENALFFLRANEAQYSALASGNKDFDLIEWALGVPDAPNVRFLQRDEPYRVCPEHGGGIEIAQHGDKGPNGGFGSAKASARTGIKCIEGHSHSAELHDGAMRVGMSANLDQGYNDGYSSWSRTHALVYPNGKRTLFTVWKGRPYASYVAPSHAHSV